jgi:Ser/Thr protein kinase RdoA (MazF antagonist)
MNANHLPVSKSFISAEALARTVETEYELPNVRCQLITASLRDVYLVSSDNGRHVLFVYRHGHRSPAEIVSEWQFVDYLDDHGVPVAPAVRRRDGELLLTFRAPEGIRYGVLTRYAAGKHLRQRRSVEAIRAYGRTVAQIHTLADGMDGELTRPANDVSRLLHRCIAAFEAEVPERPEDLAYLRQCGATLRARIDGALPQEKPYYGLIHGDVIRANLRIGDDGSVTLLDFDLCGPGWRVYDVASYLVVVIMLPEREKSERAFLSGYEEVRQITAMEREALPLFEAVRAIFDIGVPAMNVHHWGSAYLHAFLDHSLDRVRHIMSEIA